MLLVVVALIAAVAQGSEFLQDVPITFSLSGSTTYVPSTGGVAIPGYTFNVGFDRFQWLGIMFQTLTSTNNYDTLILQRSTSPSSGVYTCTIGDYYVSSGRPTVLQSDTITSNDKTTTSNSNSSTFSISFPRTIASTNGQDWEGGQFVKICFFTSTETFNQNTWSKQYQVCYGYQVSTYVSTYKGSTLGSMDFEGVSSQMYGGIYGPFLNVQLFWYRNSATISNTSNMIIRIGNQISADLGYDYYVCGTGDHYGTSTSALYQDLIYSGYNDGSCTFSTTASSVFMSYSRDLLTFDSFDASIGQVVTICLIGAQESCSQLTLPLNYPIMTVQSALTVWQPYLQNTIMLFLTMLLLLTAF